MSFKRTYYYLNTTFACGCVCLREDGFIDKYDSCPMYRKVFGQERFWSKFDQLKRTKKIIGMVKIGVEYDPF